MTPKISIAALGTSLTAGLRPSYSWQQYLDVALRVGSSEYTVTYNFGVGGANSLSALSNLKVPLHVRPDIVLLEYTINDSFAPASISTAQCEANTLDLICAFRENDPSVSVLLMILNPPVSGTEAALARPNYSDYKAVYQSIAAQDPTVGLIDCSNAWGTPTVGDIPDGLHPSAAKVREVEIPIVASAIDPLIQLKN